MRSVTVLVLMALAAMAVYQLRSANGTQPLDVLLPGESINASLLDEGSRERVFQEGDDGCFIALVMDPDCPHCIRLAAEQGQRMMSVSGFYWLFAGSREAIATFAAKYRIPADQVLRLAFSDDVGASLRTFGVSGTPMRIVVRRKNLMVKEVRGVGQALLDAPDSGAREVCDDITSG